MMKQKHFSLPLLSGLILLLLVVLAPTVQAAAPADEAEKKDGIIEGLKVGETIKIDGNLDEKAWRTPPIKKKFITHTPVYGYELPMETLVWVAYDAKNLYFAFKCHDPEPRKIKTSITKRDNIYNDDWVSVAIDATGGGQTGYLLFVNPNGIQADALTSSMHIDDDFAPDFVWQSASKITEKGYQVEICLPLKSIRFKSGKKVEMGILFKRRIDRLSYTGAWPEIKLNQGILTSMAKVVFGGLKKQVKFEILPSLTHSSTSVRETPDDWSSSDSSTDFGVGIKYGITSSSTAELAINPDFSQVETDALQVEVNQRYQLFYSEKRPFFMEGAGIFNFWTYVYGFFPKAVHTRQIVDPGWGAKVTGNIGKFSFGVLSAGDEAPGRGWTDGVNPYEGKNTFFGIARGKFGFGKDNYVGFLYSGRDFADQYNHVVGTDFSYRIDGKHWFRGSYLHSISEDGAGNKSDGSASGYANFTYTYGSKSFIFVSSLEHIGRELQMDGGYLLRNGVNVGLVGCYINFYNKNKKLSWLKVITPSFGLQYTHDLFTGDDDLQFTGSVNFYFTKNASFSVNYQWDREYWLGQDFNRSTIQVSGAITLTKWLRMAGYFGWNEGIYYYTNPAFLGSGYSGSFAVVLQPSEKFNQRFSLTHADLSYNGQKLYDVNILYSRTTYQFNRYFFLRAILQYNSYQKRLLTDFLASFTLIPGTVLHVGYGGMYHKRDWVDNRWIPLEGRLYNTKRSFFAKVSYNWRF